MYTKELNYYFASPVAYIIIGIYLLVIALFLWVIPGSYNIPDSGYANADGLFSLSSWLFMLLCPALSMRLYSEERSSGTWNILRTQPISVLRIVVSKFFAAWTIVVIAQLPCLIHYILLYNLAEPVGNVDSGAFFGSFLGMLCLSFAFTAVSTFVASFFKNQIAAAIVGIVACFVLFYGFDLVASLIDNGSAANVVRWFGLNYHYLSISRGVVDLRDVTYFASVGIVMILSSAQVAKTIK